MMMPTIQTLRKYYPLTELSDEKLMELTIFVQGIQNTCGISPDNKTLRAMIAWEEQKL